MNYQLAKNITLIIYSLLILNLFYIAWTIGPEEIGARLVLGALFNLGLWLVLYGLIKASRRSFQWLCFILLMYFIAFVQALFSNGAALAEILGLILVVTGFVSAMFAARWSFTHKG